MSSRRANQVLAHLHRALTPADGQLLARFVGAGDEAAFAALVRRHGPMVLGVCRRLLRHTQDAEDAFQATFLLLARKAASLADGDSVGAWLYGVAYRTALEARAVNVRRRARERQVEVLPHPVVMPAEPQDWRPLLDRELSRLPRKYQVPVVLCDLEGQTRKEAARQLRLPEGTLSSRLATARRLLARRLARFGLSLSGGALAAALAEGASAAVPAALVVGTVKVAAGPAAAVTAPALLMNEVLKAMMLTKVKLAVAAVMVTVALGAGGFVYRASGEAAPPARKPANELEALRRENELLKLNLEVVLEKVRALDAEVRALRGRPEAKAVGKVEKADKLLSVDLGSDAGVGVTVESLHRLRGLVVEVEVDTVGEVEAALKAFREARDTEAKRRAADALEKALKKLRQQINHPPEKSR
jgi:RNA polymerase sigma factor (sigma-70 family)